MRLVLAAGGERFIAHRKAAAGWADVGADAAAETSFGHPNPSTHR